MKKFNMKIHQDGEFLREIEIQEEVIKIGRLSNSHLRLDGDEVSRLHAVIECSSSGVCRLLDLGSMSGSYLNGERIERDQELPSQGDLRFGNFWIEYVIEESNNVNMEAHHFKLFSALVEHLSKIDEDAAQHAKKISEAHWRLFSDNRKREWLRLVIRAIREAKQNAQMFERKRVATMLNLGMEGIEKIFALTSEEAIIAAHEMLLEMAVSKQALDMLDSLGFVRKMAEVLPSIPESQRVEAEKELNIVRNAHVKLVDRLQNAIVAGSSVLPLYLARGGGREATEADKAQWQAAFDQIEKADSFKN